MALFIPLPGNQVVSETECGERGGGGGTPVYLSLNIFGAVIWREQEGFI